MIIIKIAPTIKNTSSTVIFTCKKTTPYLNIKDSIVKTWITKIHSRLEHRTSTEVRPQISRKIISIYLSEEELKLISDVASFQGIGVSTFCRISSLKLSKEFLKQEGSAQ